ncbi:HAD family hydrolase [Rothia terrae]|uniref:HAD family hydrolase n=1 Tax=Rothia terrae TaxID=396015 RepID=UPI001D157487|nr:HAD family hydrolase [Rothia terrae]
MEVELSQLIFLDVDGTVCDYEGKVPASAVQAIRATRANGHLVYLCTGRSRAEIYQELWDIGVDGLIGGNGSYVEHREEVVAHQLISAEDSRGIVDWLTARGLPFFLESNNGLFASPDFEEGAATAIRDYAAGKGNQDAASFTVRKAFPEMIFDGELYRSDLNKISFVLHDYQDFLDAKQQFPHLKAGTWGGKGEHALFGDLALDGITKATAMQKLVEHLNKSQADTVAFGDAAVDIPMFEYAARSVAMGNSGQGVKDAADWVTADATEDGLYKGFAHLELI